MGLCCNKEQNIHEFRPDSGLANRNKIYSLKALDENNTEPTIEIEYEALKEIPQDALHIRKFASYDEQQYPLWVSQGSKLTFLVKGAWQLYDGNKSVDSHGDLDNDESILKYPIGALLGYVQGGKVFGINNNTVYVSPVSGCLFLFQNNGNFETRPSGFLDIFILGGRVYEYSEIESLSGWSYPMMNTGSECYYLSDRERDLLVLINKLRYNPKLFAEKYITHLLDLGKAYEECYDMLSSLPTGALEVLQSSKMLYKIASGHAKDMGDSGLVGHESTLGKDLNERIQESDLNIKTYGENCSYGKSNPLAILLQLLVDDENDNSGHRENFFKEEFTHVGISIKPHDTYEWNCVQTFGSIVESE